MSMLAPDPIYLFKGEMDSVSCIAFKINSTNEYLYAGTIAGVVHVWDLKSKREIKAVKVGEDSCISIHPSEENVVICHEKSGRISLWEDNGDSWLLLNSVKTDFFGFCKFFLFENSIYTSEKDSKFRIISTKTFEPKSVSFSSDFKLGEVMSFKVFALSNRKLMLVAYEGCKLVVWDLEKCEKVSWLEVEKCPMAVDFEPQSCKGICGHPGENMLVFSLSKGLELKEDRKVPLMNAGVASVKIRSDRKLVAVGCWDGKLRLYSWKSLVLLVALEVHSSTVQDICFTDAWKDNGKTKFLLAAGSQDGKISLWDLYN